MADGSEWPRISIVTPNYNYERYLEETIRSVLLQGYPNIEFIIQDDGSTDGSVELIKRYEKYLAYWSSEPNSGQPSVINRGLHRSTGSILAYINSDDYYAPNAFGAAARVFHQNQEVDFINGRCGVVDEYGNRLGERFGDITRLDEVLDLWNVWWNGRNYVQPETFWRRRIWERVGDFRTDLYSVFDYEYWCRMLLVGAVVRPVDAEAVSGIRKHVAVALSMRSRPRISLITPLFDQAAFIEQTILSVIGQGSHRLITRCDEILVVGMSGRTSAILCSQRCSGPSGPPLQVVCPYIFIRDRSLSRSKRVELKVK